MTDPLDNDAIAPLLALAKASSSPAVALSALRAAASFELTPPTWRDVADALYQQIELLAPGSHARQQALSLGTRIPLRSWREHLCQMADDANEPDADVLNQALVQAREPSRIDWVLAHSEKDPAWAAQALACLPIEQRLRPGDLPLSLVGGDAMALFWLAMARARLGEYEALDKLLAGALGEVPLFWGSPWTAYDAVARVRPLPQALHDHMLQWLERRGRDDALSGQAHDVQRARDLTLWAATGLCDAQGIPRSESDSLAVLGASRSGLPRASAKARASELQKLAAPAWFDIAADAEIADALSALPQAASPGIVRTLLREANRRAAALPADAPANILLGNHVSTLVGALPIDGPEPVAEYVQLHLSAPRPALDDGQIAWWLSRDEPAHLIETLALLAGAQTSSAAASQVLGLLEGAADCQAGRMAGPIRGDGPGGAADKVVELIDDLPEQMSMAAPMADEAGIEPPMPPAPKPAAPMAAGAAPPRGRRAVIDTSFGAPASAPRHPPAAAAAPARPAKSASPRAGSSAPTMSAPPAPEAEERRVNALILHQGKKRQTFVADADNTIRCWIGMPERGVASADQAIAQVEIPATGLSLMAQLCWVDSTGMQHQDSQPVLLPPGRTASSNQCDLRLSIPAGERYVRADIAFLYAGRMFEAILLEAFVLEPGQKESKRDQIRITVQAAHRQVIEIQDSTPVDTVVMIAPPTAPGSTPAAATAASLRRFGGRGNQHFDLHRAANAIAWLNDTLHATQTLIVRKQAKSRTVGAASGAVDDFFDDTDPDARSLLLDMARHGTLLFKELCDQGFTDPGERVQILCEDGDDHVPLEFAYDRGFPSAKAQWCKPGLAALREEAPTCPVCTFPGQEGELGHVDVLCPYGFWSLRKVIERMSPVAIAAVSDPGTARRLLSPMTSVAFASSHLVPEPERQATLQALQQHFDTVLPADDWLQWRKVVKQHPALLMVLPHHGIASQLDYLEIGDQNLEEELGKLSAAQIDEKVVNPDCHDPGPVVLLLGCQTARISETGYGDLASRIHRQHASIVLGTLAQILGRHAGPIAREFALTLADLAGHDRDFGTVMLQVRQRMLARGCLIAMCLVAQGDAQWRIQGRAPRTPTPVPPNLE